MPTGKQKARKIEIERRNMLIFDMYAAGHRTASIVQALDRGGYGKLTRSTVQKSINAMLEEQRAERLGRNTLEFDLKLDQLNQVIQTNWGVITRPCVRCTGRGDMGQDPDKAPGTMMVCDKCGGDGRHHHPRDRATASKEVRLAIDQQCKMLGLYAPEKFALTDTEGNDLEYWHNETKGLDEADLDKELEVFLAGVDAARSEQKHAKEASRGPIEIPESDEDGPGAG